MTIQIDCETSVDFLFDYEALIRQVIEAAMDFEKCPYEAEINVILTDNESIHEMNLEYRQIDAPTDVLSFPAVDYIIPSGFDTLEENAMEYFNPDTGELVLGDIVISVEKVKSQATEYGHSNERELGFLVAHSMLHLFGYDHMEEQERAVMEEKQRQILNSIGLKR